MMREPLVLIPPMLCDSRVFALLTAELSRDYCVTYAPTGGADRIEEIASRILDWTPARFALLGLSMGGAVALEVLRRAPDRVSRIALMDCTSQAETPQEATAREPLIVAARAGRFADVVRQEVPLACLSPGPQRRDVHDLLTEMAWGFDPAAYVLQARAMQRRRDQSSVLRQIKQPAVVICGRDDPIWPVRRHAFMAEMIPGARLEIIDDAGHMPPLEQAPATAAVVRAWLERPTGR